MSKKVIRLLGKISEDFRKIAKLDNNEEDGWMKSFEDTLSHLPVRKIDHLAFLFETLGARLRLKEQGKDLLEGYPN